MKLPKYELYETGSQLRRSSKGITANIVEGYGRRKYKADFIRFLIYAHASCDETILHLNFINDIHQSGDYGIKDYLEAYDALGRKINRFIKYVEDDWK
jgi:four helix bundle protein